MKKKISLAVILAVIIGIALSASAAWTSRNWETRQILAEFENKVDERVASLEREIGLNLEVLFVPQGLYEALDFVTRKQFHVAVTPQLARHASIQAIEWIPRVAAENRLKYESLAQADGLLDFKITERRKQGDMVSAGERDEYFPVYYMEPMKGNEKALGFDLASSATRLSALVESRDSGRMLATARITLVQEKATQKGFLAFLPFYKGNPSTLEERRESLRGFALGVFRVGDMLETALSHFQDEQIEITLNDLSAAKSEQFLHRHSPQGASNVIPGMEYRKLLKDTAGRQWGVTALPTEKYFAARLTWQSQVIFMVGLIFTSLLAVYLNSEANKKAEIERLVEVRTAELRLAKEKAEAANKAKSDFLNMVSHELRTPLTVIMSNLQEISNPEYLKDMGKDEILEISGDAFEQSEHLLRLINDVLDLSKIEAGKMDISMQPISANDAVDEAAAIAKSLAEKKGLTLVTDIPTKDITAQADPMRLKQILLNLLGNSVKFSDNGEILVAVRKDGRFAHFSVQDKGCGIPEDKLDNIFNIFEQVDYSSTRAAGGTGLGLAITKRLIHLHGGDIEVASKVGKGSTFTFTIPLAVIDDK